MDASQLVAQLRQANLTPPETLTIAITTQCNLHCSHCWVAAGPVTGSAAVPEPQLHRVIAEFSALGGAALRLTGGEPLLHPDWLNLLQFASSLGLKLHLQTNGILFDAPLLQQLKSLQLAQLNIQISLDGATAATHDLVRGQGAYDQALDALQQLIDYGFAPNLALFFTEMRHNLHELPELLLLADRLGVGSVSSGCLVACGRARADMVIAPPDPVQYTQLLQRYADDAQFRHVYARLGRIAALEWDCSKASRAGCALAKTPYLNATGILYPCLLCHADDYSVADVFNKGFATALIEALPLWSALQKISQQRSLAVAECQTCVLKESCAAGCMGRAWGSFGEILVVEDRCQQRQQVMRWKEKNRKL